MTLKADIGRLCTPSQPIGKYRSPAYRRRQERRRQSMIPSVISKIETDVDNEASVVEADVLLNSVEQNECESSDQNVHIGDELKSFTEIEGDTIVTEEVCVVATDSNNDTEDNNKNEALNEKVQDVSTELHMEGGEPCVEEIETTQNFVKPKTAAQEKNVTENEKVDIQPTFVTINATAVLEKSPNEKFVSEEWGSLLRFLGRKEHLLKNIANVTFAIQALAYHQKEYLNM